MPTLYLIDGSAYIYRAFFALPPLSNSKGLQTNAVYGFTTMLLKVLRDHHPDYVAVVFDEKGPTHRHEAFKEYKAQRPPMPQGMSAQVPYIHRVVEALSLPVIRQAGYEADAVVLDDTALPHPQELTVRERVERALYLSGECRVTQKYVAGKAIL